jgi:hypothetical protein
VRRIEISLSKFYFQGIKTFLEVTEYALKYPKAPFEKLEIGLAGEADKKLEPVPLTTLLKVRKKLYVARSMLSSSTVSESPCKTCKDVSSLVVRGIIILPLLYLSLNTDTEFDSFLA